MKYELTENTQVVNDKTLYQIRALRDIGDRVKAGDLGGWVPNQTYLNQKGDCWIDKDVKVSDQIHITSNAYITGDLIINDYGWIGDDAYIDADGTFGGTKSICDNARIASDDPNRRIRLDISHYGTYTNLVGNVWIKHDFSSKCFLYVKDNVTIDCPIDIGSDSVHLAGNETILIPPTVFKDRWPITITPKYINIGCEHHTAEEWFAFDDVTIADMDVEALDWWKAKKETIHNLHRSQVNALKSIEMLLTE